jgi:hypothetical protein
MALNKNYLSRHSDFATSGGVLHRITAGHADSAQSLL